MGGCNKRDNPESVAMVVDIKKNIRSRKAMSAIEPALTSGVALLGIVTIF